MITHEETYNQWGELISVEWHAQCDNCSTTSELLHSGSAIARHIEQDKWSWLTEVILLCPTCWERHAGART